MTTEDTGTTGVKGTHPGQAVGGPIANPLPDGPFTSSCSHTGLWRVPRIGGAGSCLRVLERKTVPPPHPPSGLCLNARAVFPGRLV